MFNEDRHSKHVTDIISSVRPTSSSPPLTSSDRQALARAGRVWLDCKMDLKAYALWKEVDSVKKLCAGHTVTDSSYLNIQKLCKSCKSVEKQAPHGDTRQIRSLQVQ
ncbi:Hypothetical_protein [Hexamita inflata]|uniref:Hypothetical_protein n=1 Tax=Hexamita inflata TaxID=28002 RepID=A0AA86UL00_9EUKA|nr:Hypothetical protein HINF_LOCUS43007 [Hexamita inflata]